LWFSLIFIIQIFDQAAGKTSFECLNVFRHLMVDIVAVTVYGCRVSALKKLTLGAEEPLSKAVADFPKRGIIVSVSFIFAIILVPYL
jgi:hypothetical protein